MALDFTALQNGGRGADDGGDFAAAVASAVALQSVCDRRAGGCFNGKYTIAT